MPIRPLLYTMAVPLMLSLLVQSLYNIVDSIFVAKLSESALTAKPLPVFTVTADHGNYSKHFNRKGRDSFLRFTPFSIPLMLKYPLCFF